MLGAEDGCNHPQPTGSNRPLICGREACFGTFWGVWDACIKRNVKTSHRDPPSAAARRWRPRRRGKARLPGGESMLLLTTQPETKEKEPRGHEATGTPGECTACRTERPSRPPPPPWGKWVNTPVGPPWPELRPALDVERACSAWRKSVRLP